MEARCFGKKQESYGFDTTGTSAYMLFYERVSKKSMRLVAAGDEAAAQAVTHVDFVTSINQ